MTAPETGWLVFNWEWVIAHSLVETLGPDEEFPAPHARLAQRLLVYRDEKFGGRVDPTHVRFAFTPLGGAEVTGHLELFMPNLRAEFRDRATAVDWAAANGLSDTKIVQRGTKVEQDLRGYGTKKLAAP